MRHVEDPTELTSEQLLHEWEEIGDRKCHAIRSHRRPKTKRRILPAMIVIAAAAVSATLSVTTYQSLNGAPQVNAAQFVASDRVQQTPPASRGDKRDPIVVAPKKVPTVVTPTVPVTRWVKPLGNYSVTSCYGTRWGTLHAGIDLAASYGDKIYAMGSGKVVQAGWKYRGLGYSVVIDYGNGWMTLYGHASQILVRTGQRVFAGDLVALVGSTGYSTGNHLHIGVAKTHNVGDIFNTLVNPASWLQAHNMPVGKCG